MTEYEGFVRYYDCFCDEGQTKREVDFLNWTFTEIAKRRIEDVLEVGCGTGRLTIPLSHTFRMTACDISSDMLEAAKGKGSEADIQFLKKDMQDIDFREHFDAIIAFQCFYYVLSDEDIMRTLRNFHEALRPGGVCVIEHMNFISLFGRFVETYNESYEKDGYKVLRTCRHTIENVPGIWIHDEFAIIDDNGRIETIHEVHRLRISTCNEMRRFLKEAGFSVVRILSGAQDREEADKNANRPIFVAIK
jgi:SAM-dependent methyltransferase